MKYFWIGLMCLVTLNGCMVPHSHAALPRQLNLVSEPFNPKPLHVDNGFHDDDGREHEPQHTRREAVYMEDLRRDDPPDQEETTELL